MELFLKYDTVKRRTIATPSGAVSHEQETPTGDVDGVNKTFTLSQTPLSNKAVSVYLDGLLVPQLAIPSGCSVSGTTVLFVTAPQNGQSVYTVYTY